MQDFEKLGQFYLGRAYDVEARKGDHAALTLYDSRDLVTHAVCVGMTGSGKTGLCIGLIEEAAIDGIPAIVIDPKGDLANLLLTFPSLRPEDFRPWINEDDARRKGMSPDEFAAQQADLWSTGLSAWGQSGERISKLRAAAEFDIYTPGSSAGIQISILKSLDAPPQAVLDDAELFRERVSSTTTSLLGLMGLQGDPLTSREHILISSLLARTWSSGANTDLVGLIGQIQSPPMQRVGVMELESFFPATERFGLAMRFNNLLASPGFEAWMQGEPLDIGRVLHAPGGKPRVAVFSIGHLPDAERMFFVAMLFNQVLAWTRQQSGTTSLRALVYMDEIAGYFPPVANPPSKGPMLTMMKQARAFGVGVVLATQNPVDIDYKGLSNAGTWFIGRLQTERDKARVLDGLEGAAAAANAGFDRADADRILSALGPRQFLLNNVHDDVPSVFETRWCLSYLRGPMTRQQIKLLMDARKRQAATEKDVPASTAAPTATALPAPNPKSNSNAAGSARPVLPPEIPQYFAPASSASVHITYKPALFATARVLYRDTKAAVETEESVAMLVPMGGGPVPVDWDHSEEINWSESDIRREPDAAIPASYQALPPEAGKPRSYEAWKKSFVDAIFRDHSLTIATCPGLKLVGRPSEPDTEFRARVAHAVRERRDADLEQLRAKYAPKLSSLSERLRKAEQAIEVQKDQASNARWGTALSAGAAILGAFIGRKKVTAGNIGRAATAARGVGRSTKEASDVDRAFENAGAIRRQLNELQQQFDQDVAESRGALESIAADIGTLTLRPKKTNITVRAVVLVWLPFDANGVRLV